MEDLVRYVQRVTDRCPETKKYLTEAVMEKLESPATSELYINEYNPGDSLQPHFDHRTTYDECIFGISLLSDTNMVFGSESVRIPRRSMYLMTGKARFSLKHSIPKIEQKRVSITFRTVA
jgi:alkylated DNA repair dioxygenase AlkB